MRVTEGGMNLAYTVIVEATEGDYRTEVNSKVEFENIVKEMNVSDDGKMIMIGTLAIRAGSIKSMCLQDKE